MNEPRRFPAGLGLSVVFHSHHTTSYESGDTSNSPPEPSRQAHVATFAPVQLEPSVHLPCGALPSDCRA